MDNDYNLFYDELSGRYFRSTTATVLRAADILNERITCSGDIITVDDWLKALGIGTCVSGNEVGWSKYTTGIIRVSLNVKPLLDSMRHLAPGFITYTSIHHNIHPLMLTHELKTIRDENNTYNGEIQHSSQEEQKMDEENKVVAEEAKPEKVSFLKKPLVRKIAKYTLIALATGGVGALSYYFGYKHGAKVALPETVGTAEVVDATVVD